MNRVSKSSRAAAAFVMTVIAALGLVVFTSGVASAHSASVTPSCAGITIDVSLFPVGGMIIGTVFGTTISVSFLDGGFHQVYPNPDPTVPHSYDVTITAPDWAGQEFTGLTPVCDTSASSTTSTASSTTSTTSSTTSTTSTASSTTSSASSTTSPTSTTATTLPPSATTTSSPATSTTPSTSTTNPTTTATGGSTTTVVAVLPPVPPTPTAPVTGSLPVTGGRGTEGLLIGATLVVALGVGLGLVSRRKVTR